MDMASKLFTFTFTHTDPMQPATQPSLLSHTHSLTASHCGPLTPSGLELITVIALHQLHQGCHIRPPGSATPAGRLVWHSAQSLCTQ